MALNPLRELRAIRPVLRDAADRFILPRFRHLKEADILRDGSPQSLLTRADLESSQHILAWCRRRLPGSFSEEELSADRLRHGPVWCIDPLDGTAEFKQGRPTFCVQASLLAPSDSGPGHRVIGGILYLPLSRAFIYATEDRGPFLERGGRTTLLAPAGRPRLLKAAVREADPGQRLDRFFAYSSGQGVGFKRVPSGSAGHTLCDLLMRRPSSPNVLIFNRDFSKEWDVSPAANALERGGWGLCDLEGRAFAYNRTDPVNRKGFVVAPKTRMGEVMGLIRSFGVSRLLES